MLRCEKLSKQGGILLFPVMILGPRISGIVLTYLVDGTPGLRRLLSRMRPGRPALAWYLAAAVPPFLILSVLFLLSRFVSTQCSIFPQSVSLALLWALWHAPAIDYLGAATPHGSYLVPFFLAFIAALTGLRVLIAWLYANTESVLLAQLVHISSTGSLVAFSPPHVTAREEALWYLGYAAALWILVAVIRLRFPDKFQQPNSAC